MPSVESSGTAGVVGKKKTQKSQHQIERAVGKKEKGKKGKGGASVKCGKRFLKVRQL